MYRIQLLALIVCVCVCVGALSPPFVLSSTCFHRARLCAPCIHTHFSKITLPSAIFNLSSYSHSCHRAQCSPPYPLPFLRFSSPPFIPDSLYIPEANVISSSSDAPLNPPISSHPLLPVSSLPGDADSYSTPESVRLSTSHSFTSHLLSPHLSLSFRPLPLTSRLTQVSF